MVGSAYHNKRFQASGQPGSAANGETTIAGYICVALICLAAAAAGTVRPADLPWQEEWLEPKPVRRFL